MFYFPEDDEERRSSFAAGYNRINQPDKEYRLNTGNALWAQEDYAFLSEYTGVIEQYYGGKVTNLNFKTQAAESTKIINDWVADKTNDKIKDIIPLGLLGSMTRLVLTNAIYFKGTWVKQFDEDDTKEEDFKIGTFNTVKTPMMRIYEEKFKYAETDKLQILEMIYEGKDLSMLVLLPKTNLKSIEGDLNIENLAEWRDMLSTKEVNIYIPKFKFETKSFMGDTLKKMGMPTAFSFNADFSGMDGTRMLYIANVIHQAFVEVNEEGTEAAAATVVVMMEMSAPQEPTIFRADHPFIFLIQERGTGNILFFGKVVDPR